MQKSGAKEIELMRRASHENVVRVEGYTTSLGSFGIVMEYIPGGDLSDILFLLTEVPYIHPTVLLRFCYDITHGMTYLHFGFSDKRIVHGNLEPNNILLTSDLRCKIGDFGAAYFEAGTNPKNKVTSKKVTRLDYAGGYIAPEWCGNVFERPTKAMDVYSVGMIFQGMLVRKPPPIDISEENVAISKIWENYNKEDRLIIDVIEREMKTCRSANPHERPSMMEVRDEVLDSYSIVNMSELLGHVTDIIRHIDVAIPRYSTRSFKSFEDIFT